MASNRTSSNRGAKLINFFSSKLFFVFTLILFSLQSLWIALSGIFPQAFDEDTHLGIIKFFTSHPNPFFTDQPASLDQYGSVIHDSSYLYRYIMTLPWRLITSISHDFMTQIVLMRLLNIGMFVLGLVLFRRLLLKATTNKLIVNISLLLVVLTPISSQLAAQINYDNLMLPLMAGSLLVAVNFVEGLKKGRLDLWLGTWFIVLASLTLLTKYTYVTILLPALAYIGWNLWKYFKKHRRTVWKQTKKNFKAMGWLKTTLLIGLVVASMGLIAERYGYNIARYHSPTPSCERVIGKTRCQSYSIYQRNTMYNSNRPDHVNASPILFTYRWLKHMNFNTMMSLSGPGYGYSVGLPLPLPYIASIVFGLGGIVLCAVFWWSIFNSPVRRLLLLIIVFYLTALWLINFKDYFNSGRRVAVQGRYLVPLLPIIYLFFLEAYGRALRAWPKIRASLATVLVLAFAAGGGIYPFILHSDDNWYWKNSTISSANSQAKKVLRYTIPPWQTDYRPYWQSSQEF